jgi:protein ImuA
MSPGDRAERISHLRRMVERIEQAPRARARLAVARELDRRLGGGLSCDGLHEIAPAAPADVPAAFGFALSLAARFMAARASSGLVAVEEFAFSQNGIPFGPGLVAHGLDLSRLVFVRAPDAPALFQTMEDALKSGALAVVVGELWRLPKYDLSVSRRLTLAARAGLTPALLTLPAARGLSSAAETRFEVAAHPSAHETSAGGGRALPGAPAVSVRLVKARGAEADPERAFRLIWRAEEQEFDEPAVPVPVAAAPADRSRQESA